MAHFLTGLRRNVRGVLGVLLALHLGVAQAAMVPALPSASAEDATTLADAMQAPGCHQAQRADADTPTVPAHHHCCDAGQCHCPIFMSEAVPLGAQGKRPDHRLTPLPELSAARSLRPAPGLRPPIAG